MGRRRAFSLGGIVLAAVAIGFVAAVAMVPEIPAAPPRSRIGHAATGSRRLLGAEPSPLEGLTLPALRKQLAAPSSRGAAVKRLLGSGSDDAPKLHKWLHRKTTHSASDYRNLLRHLGANVPDSRGRFRQPPGVKNLDWLEALVKLEPSDLPSHLRPTYPDTLLNVVLLRAVAATRHPDAAISLLRFAYRHGSAFKDECGRQIRRLGVHAAPGLLRARALRDPLAYKMVRYADYQLDRINCTRPDRVLRKADPDLRAEILHAYGEVRSPTAVPHVLRYADDRSPTVRQAARWAMLRYVSGRPPRVVKRRLKLPGGKQTGSERALYLTYRQLAVHTLVDRLAEALAGPQPEAAVKRSLREEGEPRYLAERLFRLMDRRRAQAQREAVDQAFALARAGKLDPALEAFNRLLAADPFHPRREEIAGFFFRRGRQLHEAGKDERALRLLTKALHLAPQGPHAPSARACRSAAEAATSAAGPSRQVTTLPASLKEADRRHRRGALIAGAVACALALMLFGGLRLVRRRLSSM
jgi:hypothetical protein